MKKLFGILVLSACALGQTDAEKLKVREAELQVAEATAQRNAAESAYYQAVRSVEQAQTVLAQVLDQAGKKANCTIDPKTAECRPNQPAK
jgi:membrane-bound lytic murein transglycosylase B